MNINSYTLIYLIVNIFDVYIISRYMQLFFCNTKSHKTAFLSYFAYYIFISIIYLMLQIPIITLLANLTGFFLLTFNYQARFAKRLLSIFLIYIIFMCIDLISTLLTGYIDHSFFTVSIYQSEFGLILLQVINYLVYILLSHFTNIKKGHQLTLKNWGLLLFIPLSSLFIILSLLSTQDLSRTQVIICLLLMLVINFSAFFLYDHISKLYLAEIERLNLLQQNRYYTNQLNLIETSVKRTNAFKHDLKNHLSAIASLLEKQECSLAVKHINTVTGDYFDQNQTINTGNADIDSILNYKIQEAQNQNIMVVSEILIPEKIDLPSYDTTIILGNIFDNAIRAVSDLEDSKKLIKFNMSYNKNRLLIFEENPYSQSVVAPAKEKLLFNLYKIEHGLGLKNVDQCVKKFNGSMEFSKQADTFSIRILMYL
ncbi:GHKL domain-containing protein [Eubacteriaceae bacterium ES2]|nr:GHKL domain-containing protein [Eubacteriaceae bacterium ES2]